MKDCNTAHYDLEPGDSDMRLICVRGNPSNTKTLRRGWYDTIHKNWYLAGGDTLAKPFYWHHLPSINKNNNEE